MLSRFGQLIVLLVLLTVCGSASAAPAASASVRPSAEVVGSSVMLADIAAIECRDEALAGRLKATAVCTSPLPGKSRKLTRDQIITALKRTGVYDSLELLCPQDVSVSRASIVVTGEAIFEAARQFVLASGSWPGTVSAEVVRLPAAETVPSGKLELRVKPGLKDMSKGRNSVSVGILVDGQVYRVVYVPVLVRMLARVLVSTRTIARGEEIGSASVTCEERDVTLLPDDIIIGQPDANWTASVPIAQGAVLRRQWVSEPPAVRSGDMVMVVVTSRAIRITDKGTASQDGRPGERIKVRLQGGSREVRGTVAGPGVVEISIGGR